MHNEIENRFKQDLMTGNAQDAAQVLHSEMMSNPQEALRLIKESNKLDHESRKAVMPNGQIALVPMTRDDVVVRPDGNVSIRDKATNGELFVGNERQQAERPAVAPPPAASFGEGLALGMAIVLPALLLHDSGRTVEVIHERPHHYRPELLHEHHHPKY